MSLSNDEKAAGCFLTVWFAWLLLVLAFWGVAIYVAMHFILKAW